MSTLSITELLPKKITIKNIGEAKNALDQISFIAKIAQEALAAFKNSFFEKFDALVGDTACQIRALFVVVFSKKREELTGVIEKIDALMKQVKAKREKLEPVGDTIFLRHSDIDDSEDTKRMGSLSLDEFCEKTGLQLGLSDDIFFLVRSFILEKIKITDIKGHEKENTELLADFFPEKSSVTKSFKKDFVMKTQRELSQQSVTFLQSFLKDKTLDLVAKDNFGRLCFSCFLGLKIIIHFLKEKKEPILIKIFNQNSDGTIDRRSFISLLFKSDDGLSFQLAKKGEGVLFVIEGFSKGMAREKIVDGFEKNGLETIILANAAQHSQFFMRDAPEYAPILEKLEQDKELLRFKALSSTIGCSVENPSLFCVDHIFASSFESQGVISEL